MTRRRLLVFGASGHGLVVAEAAAASGWEVAGFCDDGVESGVRIGVWEVLEPSAADDPDLAVIVAIGVNATRRKVAARLEGRLESVVHPSAVVSPSATVGNGVFVGPRAVVHAEAEVGPGAIVNTAAVVEHHVRIGAFAHIAPGAVLTGAVEVGEETLVGANAVVAPGCKVGSGATVGAGATVIRAVDDGATVVGVPARPINQP